jgi:hypothetical protein
VKLFYTIVKTVVYSGRNKESAPGTLLVGFGITHHQKQWPIIVDTIIEVSDSRTGASKLS